MGVRQTPKLACTCFRLASTTVIAVLFGICAGIGIFVRGHMHIWAHDFPLELGSKKRPMGSQGI